MDSAICLKLDFVGNAETMHIRGHNFLQIFVTIEIGLWFLLRPEFCLSSFTNTNRVVRLMYPCVSKQIL